MDRKRKKTGSNKKWMSPSDPDARITKMKDGATHLAYKAEHAVDMETPLEATVFEMERLRCNACTQVFTAEQPECVGPDKYDTTAVAMIALLKYGSGVPFHRVERLEGQLGIPLPAATQWELVEQAAGLIGPVLNELIRQAAQGGVMHNDDTSEVSNFGAGLGGNGLSGGR